MLRRQANRQRELARKLFYSLKSLDVEIADAERLEFSSEGAGPGCGRQI